MRILLIEDDYNLRMTLTFQLEQEGFTVDACGNGEDALYYMDSKTHDLILLDRMLPKTDGITLLKKFRDKGCQTPVIILTALGELSDKVTGLDAGADDYLVKPFEFEELLARIRSISRRPRQWEKEPSLCIRDITYSPGDNQLSGALGSCSVQKRGDALRSLSFKPGTGSSKRHPFIPGLGGGCGGGGRKFGQLHPLYPPPVKNRKLPGLNPDCPGRWIPPYK